MSIFKEVLLESDKHLIGKQDKIVLSICAIISGSNVLIEDVPGVGKTTLVKTIAEIFNLNLSRIQFTNDILPSDILGINIYNKDTRDFDFHKGPIFGELILADELNRAPAKTQSALLQAMEEKTVNVENNQYQLSENFSVFATQNPSSQIGTFELPESQLDRFSLKFDLGYADKPSTIKMLKNSTVGQEIVIKNRISSEILSRLKKQVNTCSIDESLLEYVYNLLNFSRISTDMSSLSNRCGQDIIRIAKAFAVVSGRDYVKPSDIQYIFPFVSGHRLSTNSHNTHKEVETANTVLRNVPLRS
jgi:MoxR-like ATPase